MRGIIFDDTIPQKKVTLQYDLEIQENHYKIRLAYGTFPDRPYDSKAVWGDDTKIRQILKTRNDD